jgi:aspartate aminotransferase-like enzyme/predicted N-acetyltransferase YhbS
VSYSGPVGFKIASDLWEFEQVFQLAYETFVEEIPQHQANAERRHVDRFHEQNVYIIAVEDQRVVGMIALRGERPFSLDEKLGKVDQYLPEGRAVCELRLLAVRPTHRKGFVFRGLIDLLVREGRTRGYDLAIISGTLRQAKLYRHLGFVPFGPRVGTDDAPFQPMYITFEGFQETSASAFVGRGEPVSFLPGPVPLSPEVQAAFERPPVYHRDTRFREEFQRTKARLCGLAGAPRVEILLGSGTLANDVVAGQISLLDAPGIVVSNGEFGERLIDHARRMRLVHGAVQFDWGARIDMARVEQAMIQAGARWLWAVVSETSTGMLNDLDALRSLARKHGAALCLDCVSAIGVMPLDLEGVYLASGASGKGLASLPGLSFVFHSHEVGAEPARLPRYLDLGYYAEKDGIPFTHSSNLIAALDAALTRFETDVPFQAIADLSRWLRPRLREMGFPILVDDKYATPAVVTIALPPGTSATALGDDLQRDGLLVAYQSEYLVRRNWFQIGMMGHCQQQHLVQLVDALHKRQGVIVRPTLKRAAGSRL